MILKNWKFERLCGEEVKLLSSYLNILIYWNNFEWTILTVFHFLNVKTVIESLKI